MKTNPLVSIITVCRNAEGTIRDTLDSVLGQSYGNIEYIVIDGASTDGTVNILREYEPKFGGRMRWISEPDDGIYDGMNKGVRKAAGAILGIINADDWYEKDAVGRVVEAFNDLSAEPGIFSGRLCVCDRSGRKLYFKDASGDVKRRAMQGMPVNHPATFVAKAVYDRIGVFDTSFQIAADYEFVLRALRADVPFISLDEDLANLRLGGTSTVGLGKDFHRSRENFLIRRRYFSGTSAAFRFFRDLLMTVYRRTKRLIFGRMFVLKRIDLESGD